MLTRIRYTDFIAVSFGNVGVSSLIMAVKPKHVADN